MSVTPAVKASVSDDCNNESTTDPPLNIAAIGTTAHAPFETPIVLITVSKRIRVCKKVILVRPLGGIEFLVSGRSDSWWIQNALEL